MSTPRKHIPLVARTLLAGAVIGFMLWPRPGLEAPRNTGADQRTVEAEEPSSHEIAERLLQALWTGAGKTIVLEEPTAGREADLRARLAALRRRIEQLAAGRSGVPVALWSPDGSRTEEIFADGKLTPARQSGAPCLLVGLMDEPGNRRVHLELELDQDFLYDRWQKRFSYGASAFRDSFTTPAAAGAVDPP